MKPALLFNKAGGRGFIRVCVLPLRPHRSFGISALFLFLPLLVYDHIHQDAGSTAGHVQELVSGFVAQCADYFVVEMVDLRDATLHLVHRLNAF